MKILTPNQIIERDYKLDLSDVYEARCEPILTHLKDFWTDAPTDRKAYKIIDKSYKDHDLKTKLFYEKNEYDFDDEPQAYHVLHYICKSLSHNCKYDAKVARIVEEIRTYNISYPIQLAYAQHSDRVIKNYLRLWIQNRYHADWDDFQLRF